MTTLKLFTALLLVSLACAAPASKDDDEKITITKDFYPLELVKYKGHHDIVNLVVPLNSINFEDDNSSESDSKEEEDNITVFFVEADIQDNGVLDYKGLYSLKNGKAKKILDNGRDIASSADDSRVVYFAASDGLYTYKEEDQTAVKYGSISESLIGIAHVAEGTTMYVLSENHEVYEVKENGNELVKLDDISDAQKIVLDYSNNLYYYTSDKKVHVRTAEGVKTVVGLPEDPEKVALLKPPFILEDGVPFIVDNVAYIIYSNGTVEESGIDFAPKALPTAFGMEAMLIQYHAYNKRIYEYNILALLLSEILDELKEFLSNKTNDIQTLATNKRASLRRKA